MQKHQGVAHRIMVRNINYEATEAEVKELAQTIAQPSKVYLPKDRETQRHKGYAFIEYPDAVYASAAVRKLHGAKLRNMEVGVDYADNTWRSQVLANLLCGQERPYDSTDIQWLVESLDRPTQQALLGELRQALEQNVVGMRALLDDRPEVAQMVAHLLYITEQVPWSLAKPMQVAAPGQPELDAPIPVTHHKPVHTLPLPPMPAPAPSPALAQVSVPAFAHAAGCGLCGSCPPQRPWTTPCQHVFCCDCLYRTNRPECPTCRSQFIWNLVFPPIQAAAPHVAHAPTPPPNAMQLSHEEAARLEQILALHPDQVKELPEDVRLQVQQLQRQYARV